MPLRAPEIFRFGLWLMLGADLVVLWVPLPSWAVVGEPLLLRPGEWACENGAAEAELTGG